MLKRPTKGRKRNQTDEISTTIKAKETEKTVSEGERENNVLRTIYYENKL